MRRGDSGLSGILALDKPQGLSSHDVVNRVRRMSGERRVGHAGTLDPIATGLMLVGVGPATRLSRYLSGHDKSYRARIAFGVATDTDDACGRVLDARATADAAGLADMLAAVDAAAVLAGMTGGQLQLPPAYSAIKKGGVTAYKAAREGSALALEPRAVTVYEARLAGTGVQKAVFEDVDGARLEAALPYWDVDLHVSKGTYIRAIARDIGAQLGCGAHLSALRRTGAGTLDVSAAYTLDQLADLFEHGGRLPWCDPVDLLGYPSLSLDEQQARDVSNGRALQFACGPDVGSYVSCTARGRLLAVCSCEGRRCKPVTVIPGGVAGVA